MQDELKPCPFCGCQNLFLNLGVLRYVSCPDCYAEGPWNDESEEEAITAWNTRVDAHPPTTNPVAVSETPVGDHQMVEAVDREAAWPYRPSCYKVDDYTDWMAGKYDLSAAIIKGFTRHRQAALTAARAQVEGEDCWLKVGFLEEKLRQANETIDAINSHLPKYQTALAENQRLRESLAEISNLPGEINPSNYDHDDVCELNRQFVYSYEIARQALAAGEHRKDG